MCRDADAVIALRSLTTAATSALFDCCCNYWHLLDTIATVTTAYYHHTKAYYIILLPVFDGQVSHHHCVAMLLSVNCPAEGLYSLAKNLLL
jgi:hypothetical protein